MPRNWRSSFAFFRAFPATFQWQTACKSDLRVFSWGLHSAKLRKTALGSNDLSTLRLKTEVEIFRGVRTPLVPLTSYAPESQCLPFDPEYVPGIENGGGAFIYGSEYREANQIDSGKRNIQYRNIPCAVCWVQMRSTAIVVPAHNSCPHGWTREYNGFLIAAHIALRKTNYICMDREMKTLPGHAGDQSGNLLYSVATKCGHGLDSPP